MCENGNKGDVDDSLIKFRLNQQRVLPLVRYNSVLVN